MKMGYVSKRGAMRILSTTTAPNIAYACESNPLNRRHSYYPVFVGSVSFKKTKNKKHGKYAQERYPNTVVILRKGACCRSFPVL